MEAVRGFLHDLVPALDVVVVDSSLLDRAGSSLLAHGSREVSLVDWVSFELMRRDRIDIAFAFDSDFVAQGFQVIDAP